MADTASLLALRANHPNVRCRYVHASRTGTLPQLALLAAVRWRLPWIPILSLAAGQQYDQEFFQQWQAAIEQLGLVADAQLPSQA